jgi:hypothetical protein
MYIERVPNRDSPPAILLRESFREGKRTRKRTIANLSHWPAERIEALRHVLKGGRVSSARLEDAFDILRSRPHGHVAAVLATLRKLGLHSILDPQPSRRRDLVLAMLVARIIDPCSKLATARELSDETLSTSLGEILGIADASADELYAALDWLLERQQPIEAALARGQLSTDRFALYDLTSTYFEGRTCPLAKLGHSRDGKKDKLQIVFGLLCDGDGCPVAVEVFEGNTGDPKTVATQLTKLRERFGLDQVVLIGDRGMLTEARLRDEVSPVEGYAWITALRAPAIQKLVEGGHLQLSLFDQRDLAEISSPDYPNERLVVCKNPLLATERTRKREELLQATERELDKIVAAIRRSRRPLRGKAAIGLQVGRVLGRYKMAKHFLLEIADDGFKYSRRAQRIAQEAALDGFYVIRTSVPKQVMDPEDVVVAYKSLSTVERAFRSYKTVDLKVRPIHHHLAERVRAHVLLCMLAYYVEWHLRERLAPILFDDHDKDDAWRRRESVVAPAQRSRAALHKARRKRTNDDLPVHSFRSLLEDLATLTKNRIQPKVEGAEAFEQYAVPTPLQQRAFELLEVSYRM